VQRGVIQQEAALDFVTDDPIRVASRFQEARLGTPAERAANLRDWLTSVARPLFSLEAGTAIFTEAPAIDPENRIFLPSTAAWVLEGIRSISKGLLIRQALGDIKQTIALSKKTPFAIDQLPLTASEGHVASSLTQPEAIEAYLKRFPDSAAAARAIIAMLALGIFAPVESRGYDVRLSAEIDETQRDLEILASIGANDPRSLRAVALSRQMQHIDFYHFLDVPRAATRAQLIAHGEEMRKQYDPGTFPPIVRDSVVAILRRIDEAEMLLQDPIRRAEYDKLLSGGVRSGDDVTMQQLIARRSLAEQNFRRAQDLSVTGDYYGAIVLLKQTIDYVPDHADAWLLLGLCQEKNPKWRRDAVECFMKAISLNPNHIDAMIALGDLYRNEKLYARALAFYEDALQIDSENARAKQRVKALTDDAGKKMK
ncbi:MAG TPA: tetratricopeptide repeat protein, partial [Thermoanaerobaculia bacterium]